jgi:multicomponent Na+:H+ antiporter subunit C
MTLTAIVITFGVTALLLSLIYRVYIAHSTLDTDTLAAAEEREELTAELEAGADDEDGAILAMDAQES